MSIANCPKCDSLIAMDSPREGHRIRCGACRVQLEVVEGEPFELDFAERREEGWSDKRRCEEEYETDWYDERQQLDAYESRSLYRAAYGDREHFEG